MRRRVRRVSGLSVAALFDALLLAALIGAAYRVFPHRTFSADAGTRQIDIRGLSIGDHASLPGVNWSLYARSVLIGVQLTCPDSIDSRRYYASIALAIQRNGRIGLIMMSPQPRADLEEWVLQAGILGAQIVSVTQPRRKGFLKSPLIAVVGSDGMVSDVAVGRLGLPDEEKLLRRILTPEGEDPVNVSPAVDILSGTSALMDALRVPGAQLIDVHRRTDYPQKRDPGSRWMPLDEMRLRALEELDPHSRVVVDCRRLNPSRCTAATDVLIGLGFSRVAAATE